MAFVFTSWANDYVGKVIKVKGNPQLKRDGQMVRLQRGSKVKLKEIISTNKGEFVTVQMNVGHKIYVFPNSKLEINLQKKKTHIQQYMGQLWLKVKPLEKEEAFTVQTPSAVAGVRGTGFSMQVVDETVSAICVCEGKVEVEAGGVKKMVEGGFGVKLMKDLPPFEAHKNGPSIRKPRKLQRLPNCKHCHSNGYGDSSNLE